MPKTSEAKFRFVVRNEDPDANEAEIRNRLQEATKLAVQSASADLNTKATTEPEGGFLGVGETAIILAVWHAAKAVGGAIALGAAGEAGKDFYKKYLSPQLRKLNLIPSKLEAIPQKPAGEEKQQPPKPASPKKKNKSRN